MLKKLNNFIGSKIAIIPARGGSTRIKNKNLKKIDNESLLEKSLNTCLKSEIFDEIIVSTDSEEIANHCEKTATLIHKRSNLNKANKFINFQNIKSS